MEGHDTDICHFLFCPRGICKVWYEIHVGGNWKEFFWLWPKSLTAIFGESLLVKLTNSSN